ncbi:MAG: 2-oxo-hepta-3-ene-1,7-dioic acid hydratase [Rhodobacteraceae bacterium]|nr:2-oxo-hepta-3-ene-1,7-dioic acid hydratase [Paracoccaceae bacterium]
MNRQQIESAARDLHRAERQSQQIGLLSLAHKDMSLKDAYAIQRHLVDMKCADGRRIIGWKIGLTSKAMQRALSIDTPDSGVLFDDMLFENGSTIPQGRFIEPRIEAEIAFILRQPLTANPSRQEMSDAIEAAVPTLEILDTRIVRADPTTGRLRNVFDTVADNAANAGIVLGDYRHPVSAFDLRRVGAIVQRNDEVEETGLGAGVCNDPLAALAWLASILAQSDQSMRSGDIILSGSFIRPVEARPGSQFTADFGEFGSVSINFAA